MPNETGSWKRGSTDEIKQRQLEDLKKEKEKQSQTDIKEIEMEELERLLKWNEAHGGVALDKDDFTAADSGKDSGNKLGNLVQKMIDSWSKEGQNGGVSGLSAYTNDSMFRIMNELLRNPNQLRDEKSIQSFIFQNFMNMEKGNWVKQKMKADHSITKEQAELQAEAFFGSLSEIFAPRVMPILKRLCRDMTKGEHTQLTKDRYVSRGISMTGSKSMFDVWQSQNKDMSGQIIYEPSFTSTSLSNQSAEGFAAMNFNDKKTSTGREKITERHMFFSKLPKGMQTQYVPFGVSAFKGENEMLLPPGSVFRDLGVEKESKNQVDNKGNETGKKAEYYQHYGTYLNTAIGAHRFGKSKAKSIPISKATDNSPGVDVSSNVNGLENGTPNEMMDMSGMGMGYPNGMMDMSGMYMGYPNGMMDMSGMYMGYPNGMMDMSGMYMGYPNGMMDMSGMDMGYPNGMMDMSGMNMGYPNGMMDMSGMGMGYPNGMMDMSGMDMSYLNGMMDMSGIAMQKPDTLMTDNRAEIKFEENGKSEVTKAVSEQKSAPVSDAKVSKKQRMKQMFHDFFHKKPKNASTKQKKTSMHAPKLKKS